MRACLDLTGLATPDRFRGIGRYADGLARGMASEAAGDLALYALVTDGRAPRAVPLAQGLAWADDPPPLFSNFTAYYLWKRARVAGALDRARVDLYHAPTPRGTPRLGVGHLVLTCHDLIPYMLGPPYLPRLWPRAAQRAVEWLRYHAADHVIAISAHTRDDLHAVTGLSQDRVTVVRHGICRALFSHEADPHDEALAREIAGPQPYFLYVGAFDPRRQVQLLLAAFARAAPTIPERLVLCGAPYPDQRAELSRQLRRLGITHRVTLVERVPEATLTALYRRATAHVMLSRYEGFGMTLLEAMACGCPVLALDASSAAELCGDAAQLLPPTSDPARAGGALARLSSDESARRDLRARGLARVQRFTWERCAARTLDVYRRVLS